MIQGDIRERYLSVPGGNVWLMTVNPEKSRPPLWVLHGGPGVPHDYLEPLEELADERPVIFYDQLGCGNSEKPLDEALWVLPRFVEELDALLKHTQKGPFHILGQSWGSMLAIEYVLTKKPKDALSLVFSGAVASTSRFVTDLKRYVCELPEPMRRCIEESERNQIFGADYQEALLAFYRRHVCRMDPWPVCLLRSINKIGSPYATMWGPSEFTQTGNLRDFERVERLREIAIPTLLTCGRYDESTPETNAFYQAHLPGSELVIFDETSHNHHLEKKKEYLETVRGFLRRHE